MVANTVQAQAKPASDHEPSATFSGPSQFVDSEVGTQSVADDPHIERSDATLSPRGLQPDIDWSWQDFDVLAGFDGAQPELCSFLAL